MYKRLEFYPEDKNGVETELIHPGVLMKTAGINSEVENFIKALDAKENKVYILVNALSAGEYYGPNRNGDYMAENVLEKYHKHFENQGRVYKHHKNKDPKRALGKVLFSSYNKDMHRVELVCELDKNLNEKFIERIVNGEYPAVSMGMRTPYDECSYCGHKSHSLSEYCKHLKYEMNKVYPDGRKVYAKNPAAKFFDISFVLIGADPTAGVMKKVAGLEGITVKSAAELGEEFLKIQSLKEADLYKEIQLPAKVQKITKDPKGNIFLSQPNIPSSDIKNMVKDASVGQIFSTLMGMQIMPTPVDFQRIVLYSQGHEKFAELLDNQKILLVNIDENTKPIYSEDVALNNFNDKLARKYAYLIPDRSLTKPLVTGRILEKVAFFSESKMEQDSGVPPKQDPLNMSSDKQDHEFYLHKDKAGWKKFFFDQVEDPKILPYKNPAAASMILSGLFYGLHKLNSIIKASGHSPGELDSFLMKRPWLIPILIGTTALGSLAAQQGLEKGGALIAPNPIARYLISVPASYLYAGLQEKKVRQGKAIGNFQDLIRKHPLIAGILGGMGLGSISKKLIKVSSLRRNYIDKALASMSEDEVDALFNDVVNL